MVTDDNRADSCLSLVRVALDQIEGSLDGGMNAWVQAGKRTDEITQISATEFQRRTSDSLVIDVRDPKEWALGSIEFAINVPLGQLLEQPQFLPHGILLILMCGSGYRSSIASSLLRAQGYSNLSNFAGGMNDLPAQGLLKS